MSESTDHLSFLSAMRTRTVYTTGQVAKILTVAGRTVTCWCDSGALRSYRLPPGKAGKAAGDRRITRSALIEFIRKNNLPEIGFDDVRPRALIVSARPDLTDFMKTSLPGCSFDVHENVIDAAFTLGVNIYHVAVLDSQCGSIECGQLRAVIGGLKWPPKVMAIACEDGDVPAWVRPEDVSTVWPGPAEEAVRRFKDITKEAVRGESGAVGRGAPGKKRLLASVETMDRVPGGGDATEDS